MSASLSHHQRLTSIRIWVASTLCSLGGVWLLLMLRDFWSSVASPEATPAAEEAFYRTENMIGLGVAAGAVLIGGLLFLVGQVKWSRQRKHRRHQSRSRYVPYETPAARIAAGVEAPAALVGPDGRETRERVRKRVRVRVRKSS